MFKRAEIKTAGKEVPPQSDGNKSGNKDQEKTLRELRSRLIAVQDHERRRIARDLHDGMGQSLSLLKLNLDRLTKLATPSAEAVQLLSQCVALAEMMSTEVRTISYLLHPPLLDELGLKSALQCLTDGFSQRSGIAVTLRIEDGFDRLPSEVEISIYRIVQECLTNVHRHSGSPTAEVRIEQRAGEIQVTIQDGGKGLTAANSANDVGVGLGGMRERVAELDGRFEIVSNGKGMAVIVSLPRSNQSATSNSAAQS